MMIAVSLVETTHLVLLLLFVSLEIACYWIIFCSHFPLSSQSTLVPLLRTGHMLFVNMEKLLICVIGII
jgi:hypothetical protein